MDEIMRQKLENLLRYQKVDIELKKLNTLIERDEALITMNKNKKLFNDAKQTMADSEQQAGGIVTAYEELCRYIEENEAVFAELEAGSAEGEEELAERVRNIEKLRSKFQSAEKKAHDLDERAKSVCRARVEAIKLGNTAKQKYNESKEKHSALINSKAEEINALKAELDKMRSTLDGELFAEYQKLANDNIFPPVVPARGDEKKGAFNCGGCGIGLSQQANTLLKDRGMCTCDHCHRIIVNLK